MQRGNGESTASLSSATSRCAHLWKTVLMQLVQGVAQEHVYSSLDKDAIAEDSMTRPLQDLECLQRGSVSGSTTRLSPRSKEIYPDIQDSTVRCASIRVVTHYDYPNTNTCPERKKEKHVQESPTFFPERRTLPSLPGNVSSPGCAKHIHTAIAARYPRTA